MASAISHKRSFLHWFRLWLAIAGNLGYPKLKAGRPLYTLRDIGHPNGHIDGVQVANIHCEWTGDLFQPGREIVIGRE